VQRCGAGAEFVRRACMEVVHPLAPQFGAQEMMTTLWALQKLRHKAPAAALQVRQRHMERCASCESPRTCGRCLSFKGRSLSPRVKPYPSDSQLLHRCKTVERSCGSWWHPPAVPLTLTPSLPRVQALCDEMERAMENYGSQELTTSLWCLNKLEHPPGESVLGAFSAEIENRMALGQLTTKQLSTSRPSE
jgi:hypothetical protein